MLALIPAFLKANSHSILALLLAVVLLGLATLTLLVGAKLRMRKVSLAALLICVASGLPLLVLAHDGRLRKVALALGLVALLLGAIGAWLGLRPVSSPPQQRIRLRKRKSHSRNEPL